MKRTYTASVTQRGQVTIPAEVRRQLGVEPPMKVLFIVEDGTVMIERPQYTLQTAFGSVKPLNRPEDFKELSRRARDEKAMRDLRKLRKQ